MIQDGLNEDKIPGLTEGKPWQICGIKGILINEKYCGDVLGQKTFKDRVIGGKVIKNTGQLPQVLIQNNHPGIVSRETFYAVQEEMKRRGAAKSHQQNRPQAVPVIPADMPSQSGWCAASAALCTAGARGTSGGKKR